MTAKCSLRHARTQTRKSPRGAPGLTAPWPRTSAPSTVTALSARGVGRPSWLVLVAAARPDCTPTEDRAGASGKAEGTLAPTAVTPGARTAPGRGGSEGPPTAGKTSKTNVESLTGATTPRPRTSTPALPRQHRRGHRHHRQLRRRWPRRQHHRQHRHGRRHGHHDRPRAPATRPPISAPQRVAGR